MADHVDVQADPRSRIHLGRAGVQPGARYRVERAPDGVLTLTPLVSIPESELRKWRDQGGGD